MNPWDALAVDRSTAHLHVSDHWHPGQVAAYLALIDRALGPVLSGRPHVLDLGCGLGRLTVPFADRHPRAQVIGVDGSARMLAFAARSLVVQYVHNDGRTLPEGPPLDAGWSVLMFQHVDDDTMAGYLRQVADRLVPGGRFMFQWVGPDADPGPLSYPRDLGPVVAMVADAGLEHVEHFHAIEPDWRWTVAEKAAA